MVWRILICVMLLVGGVAILVQRSVTKSQIRTIADAAKPESLGGIVTLAGRVTSAAENRFILDDGTGKAEIYTCPVWYKRINVYERDRVTVVGQVMRSIPKSSDSALVLSAYKIIRGGAVIEVRRKPGKPPWISHSLPESSASLP